MFRDITLVLFMFKFQAIDAARVVSSVNHHVLFLSSLCSSRLIALLIMRSHACACAADGTVCQMEALASERLPLHFVPRAPALRLRPIRASFLLAPALHPRACTPRPACVLRAHAGPAPHGHHPRR
jgi:hypothetical protein